VAICSVHEPELVLVVDHLNTKSERRTSGQSSEGVNCRNQSLEKWQHVSLLPAVATFPINGRSPSIQADETEVFLLVQLVKVRIVMEPECTEAELKVRWPGATGSGWSILFQLPGHRRVFSHCAR
jgi:hypothetical protein